MALRNAVTILDRRELTNVVNGNLALPKWFCFPKFTEQLARQPSDERTC